MAGARFPLMRFPNFKAKALTFSYDDGPVWDRKLIELMSKYSVKGTFNLNSHRFNFAADNFDDTVKEQRELYVVLEKRHEDGTYSSHADSFVEVRVSGVDEGIDMNGEIVKAIPVSHQNGVIFAKIK